MERLNFLFVCVFVCGQFLVSVGPLVRFSNCWLLQLLLVVAVVASVAVAAVATAVAAVGCYC